MYLASGIDPEMRIINQAASERGTYRAFLCNDNKREREKSVTHCQIHHNGKLQLLRNESVLHSYGFHTFQPDEAPSMTFCLRNSMSEKLNNSSCLSCSRVNLLAEKTGKIKE